MNIIITGASSNHFFTLINCLNNFIKFKDENIKIIVYNLGLKENEIYIIKDLYSNNIDYRVFDYSKYPKFVNINKDRGYYAWKPIIIYEIMLEYKTNVIWLDSGTLFNNNISPLFNIIEKEGIYAPSTNKNTIEKWCHKKTLEIINYKIDVNKVMRLAGAGGYNFKLNWVIEFITEFKNYSLNKDCIAPIGSNFFNHRQDQSIYSILYYKYNKKYKFKIYNNFINFSCWNDIEDWRLKKKQTKKNCIDLLEIDDNKKEYIIFNYK